MVLIDQDFALLDGQSGKGKHTDLIGDVIPGSWGVNSFKFFSEEISHFDDSAGNIIPELSLPGIEVLFVVENFLDDQGSVKWGTGVHFSGDDSNNKKCVT